MSIRTKVKQLSRLYWFVMHVLEGVPRSQAIGRAERMDYIRLRHIDRNPMLRYGAKFYSQNDEDGLIAEISRRIFGERVGTFLELGVGNGTENNTLNLLALGWRGAWLGGVPLALSKTGDRLTFKQCWIEKDNVASLSTEVLRTQGIEELDILSMDLDGNDFHFCRQLLNAGFKPALWIVEYNGRFSPDTQWIMDYDRQHRWTNDDYFGASLRAFHDLLAPAGYKLIACNVNGVNAFFVNDKYSESFPEVSDDWHSVYMPAEITTYPWFGHTLSTKTIESFL